VMAQTMYTHLNKCKNNKRRKKQNCCFKWANILLVLFALYWTRICCCWVILYKNGCHVLTDSATRETVITPWLEKCYLA
jgi:hypothetical protein